MNDPTSAAPPASDAPARRRSWKKPALVIGTLAVVAWLGTQDDNEPTRPDAGEARYQCEQWVKKRLKAPATAKFSDVQITGSDPSWTVTGAVDSENGFGAMLRSSWTCNIRLDGETWRGGVGVG